MEFLVPRDVASILSVVALCGVLDARPAAAQETAEALLPRTVFTLSDTTATEAQPLATTDTRPAPLVGLYVSFATLQALDVASTQKALGAGGVEMNPIVARFAGSPLALTAVKAGVAGAMIFASERMWKTNRKAAVLTMIGLNAAYMVAIAHNYRVAASHRR